MKKKKDMTSRALAKKIASLASDHKAIDIAVLDLRKLTSFTDFFIICSGASDRQVQALASAIYDGLKKLGHLPLGEEGLRTGHWALIDYGDVVTHIFYASDRVHYQLEKLWYDAPRLVFKGING
jgi:ribosome-associated protein